VATLTDHQLGMKVETTHATPVTVDRFLPMLSETSHSWNPRPVYGQGLVVGSQGIQRGDRHVMPIGQGELELKVELQSKGLGVLLGMCHPTSGSTLVSGTTYQQVFTPARSTLFLPSATIQMGVIRAVSAGTADAHTYAGCTCTGWTLEVPEDGIPTFAAKFDAISQATATALATASYATSPTLYHHDNGTTKVGGTVTVPTTTALGTSTGTAANNVRSWSLEVDWGMDVERWNVGGRGQPPAGVVTATLNVDIEYDSQTHRDAYLAGTASAFLGNLTTAEALSTGTPTIQVAIPQVYWDEGGSVPVTNGEITRQSLKGTVTYDGTNQAWYVTSRTADSAL
jgi:hypothetical protein